MLSEKPSMQDSISNADVSLCHKPRMVRPVRQGKQRLLKVTEHNTQIGTSTMPALYFSACSGTAN